MTERPLPFVAFARRRATGIVLVAALLAVVLRVVYPASPAVALTGGAGVYTGVAPFRLTDTRDGTGGVTGPVLAGRSIDVAVLGRGGVPAAGVMAVAINLTVVGGGAAGFATVHPTGTSLPTVSNSNFVAGQVRAAHAIVKVGAGGQITVFVSADAHLVVDVTGFFSSATGPAGLTYRRFASNREFDSRVSPVVLAGGSTTVRKRVDGSKVRIRPNDAGAAAFVNITVTNADASGYVTLYPGDLTAVPLASNINFVAGQTVANSAIVRLDPTNRDFVVFVSGGPVDVIIDVLGMFVDSASFARYHAVDPLRMHDTRSAIGGMQGPLGTDLATFVVDEIDIDRPGSDIRTGFPVESVIKCREQCQAEAACRAFTFVRSGVQAATSLCWVKSAVPAPTASACCLSGIVRPVTGTGAQSGVVAVAVNVTSTASDRASHLTGWRAGSPKPATSLLNWAAGESVPNFAIIALSDDGKFSLQNNAGAAHVIVDVNGYFIGGTSDEAAADRTAMPRTDIT